MRFCRLFLKLFLGLCVITLGISADGCSYKSIKHGSEITKEQVAKIVDGKTTREEILVEFGDPSKMLDNERVYFYTWTRGSKSSFLGLGGGSAYTKSLVIVFDENGVVKKAQDNSWEHENGNRDRRLKRQISNSPRDTLSSAVAPCII